MRTDKLLETMNDIRRALGYGNNPFKEREIGHLAEEVKKRGCISTGCFTFSLSKNKKSMVIKPDFSFRFPLK